MSCTAQRLNEVMAEYMGGSERRYRHQFNPRFIYTEGAQAVAEAAGAYWLLDLIGLEISPIYAAAWLKGEASIGIVTLEVFGDKASAKVTLSLEDDAPVAFERDLTYTDFPQGKWNFYLGTDEIGEDSYVTTLMIPAEY
jgi:ABC-type dipeptide/oligopeptide/nickel transport system permease subunit